MSELQQPGGISMKQSTHSALHIITFISGFFSRWREAKTFWACCLATLMATLVEPTRVWPMENFLDIFQVEISVSLNHFTVVSQTVKVQTGFPRKIESKPEPALKLSFIFPIAFKNRFTSSTSLELLSFATFSSYHPFTQDHYLEKGNRE